MAEQPLDSFSLVLTGQSLIKEDLLVSMDADSLPVIEHIRSADFAFTGYEGTIRGPHGGWPMKSSFLHASPPVVLDCLKGIGFNLLSLSNNHAFDLGPNGVLSTLDEVSRRGLTHAGIGQNLATAVRAGVAKIGSKSLALVAMDAGPQGEHVYATDSTERIPARPGSNRLRVHTTLQVSKADLAVVKAMGERLGYDVKRKADNKVGFRPMTGEGYEFYGLHFEEGESDKERRWADTEDVERNLKAISEAAKTANCVVAYVHHHHWDPKWEQVPDWFQRFARQCVDAGAGVVVSHGVPMLQGIEIYKGAPLLFGLGNFIFHTYQPRKYTDERIWQSVVARCVFQGGTCSSIDLHPIVLGGERAVETGNYESRRSPHIAHGAYGESILRRLAEMSAAFGTNVEIDGNRGVIRCAA